MSHLSVADSVVCAENSIMDYAAKIKNSDPIEVINTQTSQRNTFRVSGATSAIVLNDEVHVQTKFGKLHILDSKTGNIKKIL
jgi:hypothetical protein